MLLSIQVRPEDIIYTNKRDGRIVVRLHYYGTDAVGAYLCTTQGTTFKEFQENDAESGKNVFVSGRGKILLGGETR